MKNTAITRTTLLGLLALAAAAALALSGCGAAKAVGSMFTSSPTLPATGTSLPKRVVVIPFRSSVEQYAPRSLAVGRALEKALKANPGTVLVDHRILESAVQRLTAPGVSEVDQQLHAARLLGINTVVRGALVDISIQRELKGLYGFRDNTPFLGVEAQIIILDAGNGTQVGETSIRRQVKITEVVADGMEMGQKPKPETLDKLQAELEKEAAQWMLARIANQPWNGVILEVDGQGVKVTGGTDNGLKQGAELLVFRRGEPIRTGAGRTLFLTGDRVARIRLTEVRKAVSWAEVVGSADKKKKITLRPGQIVRIP